MNNLSTKIILINQSLVFQLLYTTKFKHLHPPSFPPSLLCFVLLCFCQCISVCIFVCVSGGFVCVGFSVLASVCVYAGVCVSICMFVSVREKVHTFILC